MRWLEIVSVVATAAGAFALIWVGQYDTASTLFVALLAYTLGNKAGYSEGEKDIVLQLSGKNLAKKGGDEDSEHLRKKVSKWFRRF